MKYDRILYKNSFESNTVIVFNMRAMVILRFFLAVFCVVCLCYSTCFSPEELFEKIDRDSLTFETVLSLYKNFVEAEFRLDTMTLEGFYESFGNRSNDFLILQITNIHGDSVAGIYWKGKYVENMNKGVVTGSYIGDSIHLLLKDTYYTSFMEYTVKGKFYRYIDTVQYPHKEINVLVSDVTPNLLYHYTNGVLVMHCYRSIR